MIVTKAGILKRCPNVIAITFLTCTTLFVIKTKAQSGGLYRVDVHLHTQHLKGITGTGNELMEIYCWDFQFL